MSVTQMIKVGDVVRLKSGSPRMVVAATGKLLKCVAFSGQSADYLEISGIPSEGVVKAVEPEHLVGDRESFEKWFVASSPDFANEAHARAAWDAGFAAGYSQSSRG